MGTLLSYLAPYIDPSKTWVFSFFGLMFPIFLIVNIGFIFFWMIQKPKYALLSVACLLLGWNYITGFITFKGAPIETKKKTIEVVSFNMSNASFGYIPKEKNQKQVKGRYKELLEDLTDGDILCLQETNEEALKMVKEKFPKHFIHHVSKGAVLVSKFPMIKKGEINFGTITNSCVWADIITFGDTIRVYSYHLKSNRISADAEKLANDNNISTDKAWYDVKSMLRKFKNYHISRSDQAQKIEESIDKCPYPVLLAGDMNDTPVSYTYKVLADHKIDAFKERGFGIGTTYAGIIPLLRIDYIFTDPRFQVTQFDIIRRKVSDHYPIKASIIIDTIP